MVMKRQPDGGTGDWLWITMSGDLVHPDAPAGAGGPGKFRGAHPLGLAALGLRLALHPDAPAARHQPPTRRTHKDLTADDLKLAKALGVAFPPSLIKPQNDPPETPVGRQMINGIDVDILPDGTDGNVPGGKAHTSVLLPYSIHHKESSDLVIESNGPGLQAKIQTRYQLDGNGTPLAGLRKGPSGYGRGTTPADLQAGNTSIGFHESCHREDYLDYMRKNKPPQFGGRVGMRKSEYMSMIEKFKLQLHAYNEKMLAITRANTDEVGFSKTQYEEWKKLPYLLNMADRVLANPPSWNNGSYGMGAW